jgi:chlorite dismutase
MEIVSDNDSMKSDAEIIHEKYNTKLMTLQRTEYEIKSELDNRVAEIEEQEKSVKVLLFDAKVQLKSNEISQETFDHVQKETDEMLQHMKHEKDEIAKVKSRLANLSLEDMIPEVSQSSVMPGTYLPNPSEDAPTETRLPEPPTSESSFSKPSETQLMTVPQQEQIPTEPESDWIKRMNSQ